MPDGCSTHEWISSSVIVITKKINVFLSQICNDCVNFQLQEIFMSFFQSFFYLPILPTRFGDSKWASSNLETPLTRASSFTWWFMKQDTFTTRHPQDFETEEKAGNRTFSSLLRKSSYFTSNFFSPIQSWRRAPALNGAEGAAFLGFLVVFLTLGTSTRLFIIRYHYSSDKPPPPLTHTDRQTDRQTETNQPKAASTRNSDEIEINGYPPQRCMKHARWRINWAWLKQTSSLLSVMSNKAFFEKVFVPLHTEKKPPQLRG